MDRTVETLITNLMHEANDADCNLVFKRVENEGYVINNAQKTRVVAVGLLNIKNEEGVEEPMVGAFTIDVSKFKWADAEGFTMDQMIDEGGLRGEIFNIIGVDEVFNFLCDKK